PMQAREEKRLQAKRRIKEAKRALKQKGKSAEAPAAKNGPEEFHRAYATEQRVRANLSEGETRIASIYQRAQAERRNLTPEEIEEIDAIADSASAAESDVRRRAASGF